MMPCVFEALAPPDVTIRRLPASRDPVATQTGFAVLRFFVTSLFTSSRVHFFPALTARGLIHRFCTCVPIYRAFSPA